LTGKLSDFAFLIVAPVLLLVLLPRAVPRRRPIALAAVTLVYTAADLSPAVSDAIVAAARWLWLPWTLWPDVTDLLALLVLPVTWWLMREAPATAPASAAAPARPRPLLESLGVFAGAFACLATSAPPDFAHAPFVVNQTSRPREITATWLLRTFPCDADLAAAAATLNPSDLDDPHGASLALGEVAVLDESPPPGQPLSRQCPVGRTGYYSGSCTGVILQVGNELTVLASYPLGWREYDDGGWFCSSDDNAKSRCKPRFGPKEDPGPDGLALREENGKLVLSVGLGSKVRVVEVSAAAIAARPPSAQGCRPLLAEQDRLVDAASSCRLDADCTRALALPAPGRGCPLYVNRSLTEAVTSDLRMRWIAQSCVVSFGSSSAAQPAVCRSERCQAVCPGVRLPYCPSRCATSVSASSCYAGFACSTAEGDWCTCTDGKVTCAPPAKPAGCPIACVAYDGTQVPPPPRDAGTTRDSSPPDVTTDTSDTRSEAGADTQVDTGL
jgi:hypothetical protein